MNRIELLDKIDAVEPALATKQTLPILSHLWFTGRHVMAYNDGIAISASMRTEFEAAVPLLLVKLLRASMATEVDMSLKEHGQLQVKASAARMSVPTFPPEDFRSIFKMPEVKAADANKIIVEGSSEELNTFFTSMGFALQCVASEATVPEQLGVTLIPAGKNRMSIFSTNSKALFNTSIKIKNPLAQRLTLSAEFVKQMLSLRKRADTSALYIHDNFALFKAGTYLLMGKLIFSEQPLDFDRVLKLHLPDAAAAMAEVPNKLKMILERAVILTGDDKDTEVTAKSGKVSFNTVLANNSVSDEMKLDGQADIKIKFSPALAKQAIDAGLDQMRLTEKCVIFKKDSMVFLVTATV